MNQIPVPPNATTVRAIINERIDEASAQSGEKITIEWRNEVRHLHVISMPLNLLCYNPDTHRIRAQRSLDPEMDQSLQDRPWGTKGQEFLDRLLKCLPSNPDKRDPDFEQLMEDLENFGQKDPGLITPDGILVNGNTRCAALRELGETHIRVGVLPSTTTWEDINSVELSLQLRKELKRDYSYINRLIAIEEQIKAGRRPEDIARHFRIQTKTLESDRWIYGVILDAIDRSGDIPQNRLRLTDFEDHQEKLRELQRAYAKLEPRDHDAAEVLKETRLAMTILGFAKTDLRLAQPDFKEKYLDSKLDADLRSAFQVEELVSNSTIPGLPGVELPPEGSRTSEARAMTDAVLKSKSASRLDPLVEKADFDEGVRVIRLVKEATDRALEPAGRDERLKKRQLAAPERLSDASDDIDLCTSEIVSSRAKNALDMQAMEEACESMRDSLIKLGQQLSKSTDEPGPGVSWVLNACRAE